MRALKVIKWLLLAALALAALLLAIGASLPGRFEVRRSLVIGAAPERVFGFVARPRSWPQWSVWNRRDPAMKIDYFGPESGLGAGWSWKSRSEGDGRMLLTLAESPARVKFDLAFTDFDQPVEGELTFEPAGTGTRATWIMRGDMGRSPLNHWFAFFADRLMGPDFEGGLANLKRLAEAR